MAPRQKLRGPRTPAGRIGRSASSCGSGAAFVALLFQAFLDFIFGALGRSVAGEAAKA
jgi:hypothetical protein